MFINVKSFCRNCGAADLPTATAHSQLIEKEEGRSTAKNSREPTVMSNPIRLLLTIVCVAFLFCLSAFAQAAKPSNSAPASTVVTPPSQSDRDQDGLQGPVRKIKTEVSKLVTNSGRPAEGPRVMLESAAYDITGKKVDTAYYPVAGGALTGRETYKYDAQGNIAEMTLLNADGSVLAKEVYHYEYDFVGNWVTMTTAVAVIEGGKISYDPTEVTHRTISYFMDEKLTRLMEASQKPATTQTASNTPTNAAPPPVQPKPGPSGSPTADPAGNQGLAANHVMESKPVETKPVDSSTSGNANPPVSNPVNKPATDTSGTGSAEVKPEPVAAPPAPKPITRPVSGGVLNGSALSLPPPRYPEMARRSRAGGLVVVEVVIDETGKVISAKATDGPAIFYTEATEAAKRAKFSPTKLSGVPVKVTGIIKYNFSVEN
jgi:TonB family protein